MNRKKLNFSGRGQVEGNVMIYVLGVFIASLILIFGYIAIKNFVGVQEDIQIINFRQDLTRDIESLSSQYGSVTKVHFDLPSELSEVCFDDYSQYSAQTASNLGYPLLSYISLITPRANNNVFLLSEGEIRYAFSVNQLSLENGFVCVNILDGNLDINMEAKGREGVSISRVE